MPLVFFSGSLGSASHRGRFIDLCDARLLSCHGQYLPTAKKWLAEAHNHPRAKERYIMLDSGAFTSWSRGENISLKEVMRNYKALVDRFAPYYQAVYMINLDVIPGSRGRTPTNEEIEQALVQSDKNLIVLQKEFGEDFVLPVYHQGESKDRLQEVAKQGTFICISPRNDLNERARVPWAAGVHADIKGKRTHGLAATGVEMMLSVPWWSVDSASWVQQAGFGGILIKAKDGDFKTIKISSDSPMRREFDAHYESSTDDIKHFIERQAEDNDLTIEDLQRKPGAREFFNIATLALVSQRPVEVGTVQQTLWAY
jgi:hypothetical protein